MGKFPVKIFESVGKENSFFQSLGTNIFESAAKFSKFENLPVAHGPCGALRVTIF
jgi:hypothetical protein